MAAVEVPLHVFRFHVDFFDDSLTDIPASGPFNLCSGAFAECTGLEATMEPKTIKEGGRNYGAAQRAGQTSFPTVVFKRGISTTQNLYDVFNTLATGTFAPRLRIVINVFDNSGIAVAAWQLNHAMPIKYKFSDLNAKNSEVGIEELHVVHEGLWASRPTTPVLGNTA